MLTAWTDRVPAGVLLRLLTSLALALLLWGWVTTQQDPTMNRPMREVPLLEPQPPDESLIVGELGEVLVRVVVEGPRSLVNDLTPGDLNPRLNFDQVDGPGEYSLLVVVDVPDAVNVESIAPRQVSVVIDRIATQPFDLEVEPETLDDAARRIGDIEPEVTRVTVSGPERLVGQIARVVLPVDIEERTEDFTAPFVPVAEDRAGALVAGVQIQPEQVETAVEVDALGRSVPVLIGNYGDLAEGFEIVDRVVNPDTVLLDGPEATLDQILSVSTEPVAIEGARESVSRRARIVGLPEGVRVVEPADGAVVVVIQIQPLDSTRTLAAVPIAVTDLAPGLAAEVDPVGLDVEIVAADTTLAALQPGDVAPRVSAAGRGPGTYPLPVEVAVPPGVTLIGNEPATVTLTIRAVAASAATPSADAE